MVFGALLGGMAMRAGERFHENADKQHELEKWQRSQQLNMLSDFAAKNWDNLQEDQQQALGSQMAQVAGFKDPKAVQSMITAAKAIHGMIPQIQAVPESLGPAQRGGTVTATPSAEPPVRGIPAPTVPQFSQLPAPGETLSPAIMAPSTGGTAYGPSYTPNQMRAQQAADMERQIRQQNISDIQASGLPSNIKTAGEATQFKIPAVPIIVGEERIAAQQAAQKAKLEADQNKIKSVRFAVRNGQQLPIYMRGVQETYDDPNFGLQGVPYHFQNGDHVYEKTASGGLRLVQDDNGQYAVDLKGVAAGTPGSVTKIPGVGGRPTPPPVQVAVRNPETGESQQKVMTRAQANKLARQGGTEGVAFDKPNTAGTQVKIDAARRSLDVGNDLIKFIDTPEVASKLGPIMGRYTNLQLALGDPDPLMAQLRGKIASFAALQPGIHGMRNYSMMTHLEKLMGNQMSPEAMKAGINGILDVSRSFANSAVGVQGGSIGGAGGPAVGEVRRGYRYNGGDPSKKESWSKVQQ